MHTPNTKDPVTALGVIATLKRAHALAKGEDALPLQSDPNAAEVLAENGKAGRPETFARALMAAMTPEAGAASVGRPAASVKTKGDAVADTARPESLSARPGAPTVSKKAISADALRRTPGDRIAPERARTPDTAKRSESLSAQPTVVNVAIENRSSAPEREVEATEEATRTTAGATPLDAARVVPPPALSAVIVESSVPGHPVTAISQVPVDAPAPDVGRAPPADVPRAGPGGAHPPAPQPSAVVLTEAETAIVASAMEKLKAQQAVVPPARGAQRAIAPVDAGKPGMGEQVATAVAAQALQAQGVSRSPAPQVASAVGAPSERAILRSATKAAPLSGDVNASIGAHAERSERMAAARAAYAVETARSFPSVEVLPGRTAPSSEPLAMATSAFGPASSAPLLSVVASPFAQRAQWTNEVAGSLVWMAKGPVTNAELVLNPANLGRVAITLQLNGSEASFVFATEHAAVKNLIEQAMPAFREHLTDAGLQPGQTTVSVETRTVTQDLPQGGAGSQDSRHSTSHSQSFSHSQSRREESPGGALASRQERDARERAEADAPASALPSRAIDFLA